MTDTHHIQTCRKAWHEHIRPFNGCRQCLSTLIGFSGYQKCESGQVLYDEYVASITAHPQCENLVATDIHNDRFLALGTPEREDQEKRFDKEQDPIEVNSPSSIPESEAPDRENT